MDAKATARAELEAEREAGIWNVEAEERADALPNADAAEGEK
jgi:hypothetical protein